jgi:hypothetical protein
MRVKVKWSIEVTENYEAEIDIPDDDMPSLDYLAVGDYLYGNREDILPGEETEDARKFADVHDRDIDSFEIITPPVSGGAVRET